MLKTTNKRAENLVLHSPILVMRFEDRSKTSRFGKQSSPLVDDRLLFGNDRCCKEI